MVESMETLEKIVIDLYRENKWKEIINLKNLEENNNSFEKHRILWVWPSIDDLNWLKNVLNERRVNEIVSVGCGSGLLEWLIEKHSGDEQLRVTDDDMNIVVLGIEVDKKWWSSGYSPPLFLNNVHFVDEKNDNNNNNNNENNNFKILPSQVILFCYFNNGPAFLDYMKDYQGKTLIIIGPGEGRGSCTDPAPFDKKFSDLGWELYTAREIGETKDYIAVYVR